MATEESPGEGGGAGGPRAVLEGSTRPGELVLPGPEGTLECVACAHRCRLADGEAGFCEVRTRRGGELRVPWGYVGARALDPVEKKPFFHLLPGSTTLTFGMLGCDFRCAFCQNWFVSQALRDPAAGVRPQPVTAAGLAEEALAAGARLVVGSYNEPLITAEWGREVLRTARERGLRTALVSNGHATPEVLAYLVPHLDACKVDLKAFRESSYRGMGGSLAPVLECLRALVASPVWVEVVTVVIPGLNDSPAELGEMAAFLAALSPDLPWHVHGFHPDYRMTERPPTTVEQVLAAAEVGRRAGLRFVYPDLVPGLPPGHADTPCPRCGATLVARRGMRAAGVHLRGDACASCGERIPGRFDPPGGSPAPV